MALPEIIGWIQPTEREDGDRDKPIQSEDGQFCTVTKIVFDEGIEETLAGLAGFEKVALVTGYGEKEAQLIRQIFDVSEAMGMLEMKVVSVSGNVLEALHYATEKAPVYGVEPYYPEYDLQTGEDNPEWITSLFARVRRGDT